MAQIHYFTAAQQLSSIQHDGSIYTSAKHFTGLTADGRRVQVERAIERKRNPSQHKCDGRCLNVTGSLCECSCGGKNHGAGNFVCVGVAA